MIGIIAAMDKEIDDIKSMMTEEGDIDKKQVSGMEFWHGHLYECEVVLVKCGVGKVNAAMAAEVLVTMYNVDSIINTGIAGALDDRIDIGDIVLSTEAQEHDMDVTGLGYRKGIIPDQDTSVYKADSRLIQIAKDVCTKTNPDVNVFEGKVVSGDQFISGREVKKNIIDSVGGMCTEMGGAAIAHVAYMSDTPFLIIRSISDKANDDADIDYPTFQKKAIRNSVKLVSGMLKEIATM